MRAIDADALFGPNESTDKVLILGRNGGKTIALSERLMRERVNMAPTLTLDDLRAHGAWITQNSGYTKFQCSVCGSKNHDICWPFCCKCGAKMDLPLVKFSEKAEREEGSNETD